MKFEHGTCFSFYEPDAELLNARLYLAQNNLPEAKSYAQSTYTKADLMHYHLPKIEARQVLYPKFPNRNSPVMPQLSVGNELTVGIISLVEATCL